ncbi:hypothetical protein ACFV0Q_41200, partial [Streptomyces sp. NPDC059564]
GRQERTEMSETERERPPSAATGAAAPASSATSALEPPASPAGGGDGTADAPPDAPIPPSAADRPDRFTDGVVELRKRGESAVRRAGADAGDHLEAMARRAAERAGRPRA